MKRVNGQLTATSWEDALATLAEKFSASKGKVAAVASTRLSVEELSIFKSLFADGLKSKMVTSVEEGRPTALQSAYVEQNGAPVEGKLDTLRTADCVLVVGANLSETHEVAGFYIKSNLPKGIRLIIIDPNENSMDDLANINLKPRVGTDAAVLSALEAAVVKEGLARSTVDGNVVSLKSALEICELNAEDITDAARMLVEAVAPIIVYGKGLTASGNPGAIDALVRLANVIGASDSERKGLLSVKGGSNSLAASLLGMENQLEVKKEAVYIALGDDFASKRLVEKLANVPYLVVQASYESELTERADLVLPVSIWAEEAGHALNTEGRLQFAHAAVTAPEGVLSNIDVLKNVAGKLGVTVNDDWRTALTKRTSVVELEL
jgi:predicted molibdopterin-dependent oxidoreductase YjgC